MSYSSVVLADTPVLYCPMDEASGNLLDRTANANDATFAGTHGVTGPDGGATAVALTAGSFVPVRWASTTLDPAQPTLSLEIMVKTTAVPSGGLGGMMLFGKSNLGGNIADVVHVSLISTGQSYAFVRNAANVAAAANGSVINDGAWHHCVLTYDGSNVRSYVDGLLVGVAAATGSLHTATTDITAGAYDADANGGGAPYRLTGSLAHAAAYQYALTSAQVLAHYKASPMYASAPYRDAVLSDNPTGYWRLGESTGTVAVDSSGNGRTGVYSGSPTLGATSLVATDPNTAVTFDASNDEVSCGTFSLSGAGATIEAIIKWSGIGNQTIFGFQANPYETNSFWVDLNSNHIRVIAGDVSAVGRIATSSTTITSGTMYHVAGVYDGANALLRVYVNGAQVGTVACSAAVIASGAFYIGRTTVSGGFWGGTIDEVACYTTALSASRIAAHYLAITSAGVSVPPVLLHMTVLPKYQVTVVVPPILLHPVVVVPTVIKRKGVSPPPITLHLTILPPPPLKVVLTGVRIGLHLAVTVPNVIVEQISPVAAPLFDASSILTGSLHLDIPLATAVSSQVPLLQISAVYPNPTLVNGRPDTGWGPTSVAETQYGYVTIVINSKDVTFVRGVKTRMTRLSLQEPFGEGTADFTIAGATEFDYGDVGFEWLEVETSVEIRHYSAAGAFVRTLWTGVVMNLQWDSSSDQWDMTAGGTFAGVAGVIPHEPKIIDKERDMGTSIVMSCRRVNGRWAAMQEILMNINTRKRGSMSQTLMDFVTEMLAIAQTDSGGQWTMGRVFAVPRRYELRLKDQTTENFTVYLRSPGTTVSLTRDLTQAKRRIMGEGINVNGGRWSGTIFPNIGRETIPTFPGNLTIGSSGSNVDIWQYEMSSNGYEVGTDFAIGSGLYTQVEADACSELQEDAGLPQTGVVNLATWNATWNNGNPQMNFSGSVHLPLYEDTRVMQFFRSANGSPLSYNPAFNDNIIPVGAYINYGENTSKKFARKSAKRMIQRDSDPGWSGTITLAGVDPPEMSKYDICEGMNVRLPWYNGTSGGILLHVAGVDWSEADSGWSVQLTVDTKARDLLTLAEMRDRNRETRQDPARAAINLFRKSAHTRDPGTPWDAEGGFGELPQVPVTGGQWNIYKIPASKYGSLASVHFVTTSPATTFCVAIFGAAPGTAWLNRNVGAPLVSRSDSYGPWDVPGLQGALSDRWFIEAFGGPKQAGGYSPGFQTNPNTGAVTGHPVTGVMTISSTTDFAISTAPIMYLAIWPTATCQISGRVKLAYDE
jgi:hypothetical protein